MNKNHLKPLDKGLKINDKQRFPRTKYEDPQHTIFYLVVKSNKTTLFNLLVSDLWLSISVSYKVLIMGICLAYCSLQNETKWKKF